MKIINIVLFLNFVFYQITTKASRDETFNPDDNYGTYNTNRNEFYRKEKMDIIYIPGGVMYRNGIGNKNSKLVRVNPFLVYDHKVTNKEYRDVLIIAKKRKLRKASFLKKLVPDYRGVKDSLGDYDISESTLVDYFMHKDNYPVVGLTYFQIMEFIRLKSEIDGKKYRLMTPDEFDFCVYEVKNIKKDNDIDIIQMEVFDENIKNNIQTINDRIKAENDEVDNKLKDFNKNKKNKKKKKLDKRDAKSYLEKKRLQIYRPSDYFNLRDKDVNFLKKKLMFTQSYKYKPNGFLIYDLIGNTYEITKELFDASEDFNINKNDEDISEKLVFTLCGGSCFDYYDNVKIEQKFEDKYDSIRYDRGFRLVLNAN